MNRTAIIGASIFIIGLISLLVGRSPKNIKNKMLLADLGGILFFGGAIIYWLGKAGEGNKNFAIFG